MITTKELGTVTINSPRNKLRSATPRNKLRNSTDFSLFGQDGGTITTKELGTVTISSPRNNSRNSRRNSRSSGRVKMARSQPRNWQPSSVLSDHQRDEWHSSTLAGAPRRTSQDGFCRRSAGQSGYSTAAAAPVPTGWNGHSRHAQLPQIARKCRNQTGFAVPCSGTRTTARGHGRSLRQVAVGWAVWFLDCRHWAVHPDPASQVGSAGSYREGGWLGSLAIRLLQRRLYSQVELRFLVMRS